MTGFYLHTESGNVAHVNGDPSMSPETTDALAQMIDLAVKWMERKHECQCRTCRDYRARVSALAPVKRQRRRSRKQFAYSFRTDHKSRKARK